MVNVVIDNNGQLLVRNGTLVIGSNGAGCCCRSKAPKCCVSGNRNWIADQTFLDTYPEVSGYTAQALCEFVGGHYYEWYEDEALPFCPTASCTYYEDTSPTDIGTGIIKQEAECTACIGDIVPPISEGPNTGECPDGYFQVGNQCVSLISNIPNCGVWSQPSNGF